jgi:adenine-specific DNA-methyltransferase
VDLASPISKEIVKAKKDEGRGMKDEFEVFWVGGNDFVACFDTGVTEELVKQLAKREPMRAVFRDASYASDSTKINIEQIFKALSPHTELKTI